MPGAFFVNDFDTRLLGFYPPGTTGGPGITGWADGLALKPSLATLPGRAGALVLQSSVGPSDPRQVVVSGTLRGATVAALIAARKELKARCSAGLVELRFADDSAVALLGYCTGMAASGISPMLLRPWCELALTFTCPDPYAYTKSPTVVGFGASAIPCPLGSGPVAPLLRIFGAATNPVVTLRNAVGAALATAGFTITLGANDYLEADCGAMQVSKCVAGTITRDDTLLTSGNFLTLDPTDGGYGTATWPTLEVSAGTAEAIYRRAWV